MSASSSGRRRARAFSLLEVMVAVTILGLVLTVVLSAQGGASASNRAAARAALAVQLSRCKMTEIEEELYRLGYPEVDRIDTELSCCEGTESDAVKCDVRVEKVELPPPPQTGGAGDGGLDLSSVAGMMGGASGGASSGAAGAGGGLNFDAGLAGLGGALGPGGPAGAGGGAAGILGMVMSSVYPAMKTMMEASIRRITVTARWRDGTLAREYSLTQFVTNPQRGGFIPGIPQLPGQPDGGPPVR